MPKMIFVNLPVTDLPMWRLRPRVNVPVLEERGVLWYPLAALPGVELRLASSENRLDVVVPESALLPQGLPPLPAGGAAQAAARPPAAPRLESTRSQAYWPRRMSLELAQP